MSELLIEAAPQQEWDVEVDVLVLGFGMAGACAALEALDAGASVAVVERTGGKAGSTSASSGHFYLGGGTPVQVATGFEDTPEAMADYLRAASPDAADDKIEAYAHGSVAHFDWLESHGIPFERTFFAEKAVVQLTTECLIWTGNEMVHPFREHATPAPRGHKVAVPGEAGGGALALQLLSDHAEERGARVLLDTKAEALFIDDGRVVGAKVRTAGRDSVIRANKGVIIAMGGFGQNAEMVAEHAPVLQRTYVVGSPYDDGLGIRFGLAAGGAAEHLDTPFLTAPFYPPQNLLKGILVNNRGERFVAEDSYHARSAVHITRQPDGVAYLILDEEIFEYPWFARNGNLKLLDGYETVEEMEQGLGIPDGNLVATMAAYSAAAANGEDPEFGKHEKWLKPLDRGPYAAFDLSYGKAHYAGFTLGGLRVDVDGRVLREDGAPVAGLYAAGASAATIALDANGYSSGTCLGTASFFGRRAGRHAGTATH